MKIVSFLELKIINCLEDENRLIDSLIIIIKSNF
jgi:hypothetical protein